MVDAVSKHEPWHKPRDEDQDEALLNWLGQKDPKYSSGSNRGSNGRNGGGCASLLIAAAGVAAAVGAAGAVIQHLT